MKGSFVARLAFGAVPYRYLLCATTLVSLAAPAAAQSARQLADLSLQELANVEVTSVSKTAEALSAAPASIYVITRDEILRSGVTTVADALRLAPNLQMTRYTSSRYVAGARGLGGAEEAQNFSNKLLILIDGRSVYSPLFSGVYLDTQDVLLEDIERIEVISGAGATLWGANAMNGVINIITRPAYLTSGTFASVGVGDEERNVSARYGGRLNERGAFRVYAKAFERDQMRLAGGGGAGDDWNKLQTGARMDWTGDADTFTAQGDFYRASEGEAGNDDLRLQGGNVLGRWQHRSQATTTQVQLYYDQKYRERPTGGAEFKLRTYDLEAQQSTTLGTMHRLLWGAGVRVHHYTITGTSTFFFSPDERTLHLGNVFAQDTIALADGLNLTLGLKLENDAFAGWKPLPDVRLAWQPSERSLLWASASRAIRSATPFDHDVVERLGGVDFLAGNPDFDQERVNAYELGFRGQPHADISLSLAAFYNVYDDLRTIELDPLTLLPLRFDNRMHGHTYGAEAWAKWQVLDSWRLAPGVRWVHKELRFDADSSGLLGVAQAGNDPKAQALLTSVLDLSPAVTFDVTLRYVSKLPEPHLSSYTQMDASLQWHVTSGFELALSGFNLLEADHLEYPAPAGERIRRSVLAQARWRL